MMRFHVLFSATLLVLGSASCGESSETPAADSDDDSSGDYSSAAPVEIEDLCPLFTSDLCLYLMQCNELDYRDAAHCEAEMQCYGLAQLEQSAATGRVKYNPDKVGACHARFIDNPCGFAFFIFTPDIFEVLSQCEDTLEPLQEDGEECVSHGECVTGYCSKEGRTCPGECGTANLAQAGESCVEKDCAPDLDCDAESICRAAITPGEPCGAAFDCFDGGSSTRDGELVDGSLTCDRRTNTCMKSPVIGEPCGQIAADSESAFYANCDLGWCDSSGFERPEGVCRADGELGGACGDCVSGLRCVGDDGSGNGACEDLGEVGSMCASEFRDCKEHLRCSPENICAEKLATGADCSSDSACQSDICSEAGKCLDAAYPGDDCSSPSTQCVFGICQDGVCVRRSRVGEVCSVSSECATGDCFEEVCIDDSVCSPE